MLTAENWCVKVHDKVYGPYTTDQLRKFAHEGRLAAWSLIAPAGSRSWREAKKENTFAAFFGAPAAKSQNTSQNSFGRRQFDDDSPFDRVEGESEAPARKIKGEAKRARPIGQNGAAKNNGAATAISPANFVIVFDVVSGAAGRIETAVVGLGPAFRLAENVWSVNCDLTAIGVRNALAPYLRPAESIFVVDASNGRTSWQNYSPEAHAKITATFMQPRVKH